MTIVNSWSNYLIQACIVHKFLYLWICVVHLFILPVFLDREKSNQYTKKIPGIIPLSFPVYINVQVLEQSDNNIYVKSK